LYKLWNWKAAILSALYRAPIFFFTSLRGGLKGAVGAMLIESLFRTMTSGFYGAATQALRRFRPEWLALTLILVVLPGVVQLLEAAMHWMRGTQNLKVGLWVSFIVTAIASLFNFYAMRRGALLTGEEGQSFGRDLMRIPILIAGFIAAGPLALWRVFFKAEAA
jgi:hypothetical protein